MKTVLLLALSAIILSQGYGFAYGAVDVDGNIIPGPSADVATISVTTDSSSYEEGEMINVSGSVSDYDESDPYKNFDVTLRLLAPNNNIISISQIPLSSDGSYSTFIPAQGPLWKSDGDYTISVSHGSDINASATFTFISISEVVEVVEETIEISEEELAEGCGQGTHLEDGVCVLDETDESTPVSTSTGSVPTEGFNSWIYSITFTLLIAFVVAIFLFLISRVRGKKTV